MLAMDMYGRAKDMYDESCQAPEPLDDLGDKHYWIPHIDFGGQMRDVYAFGILMYELVRMHDVSAGSWYDPLIKIKGELRKLEPMLKPMMQQAIDKLIPRSDAERGYRVGMILVDIMVECVGLRNACGMKAITANWIMAPPNFDYANEPHVDSIFTFGVPSDPVDKRRRLEFVSAHSSQSIESQDSQDYLDDENPCLNFRVPGAVSSPSMPST